MNKKRSILFFIFLVFSTQIFSSEKNTEKQKKPLLHAIQARKPFSYIKSLVNNKANINEKDQQNTPLIEASRQGKCDIVKLLLTNNANPHSHCNITPKCNIPFCSAISVAATIEIRDMLIAHDPKSTMHEKPDNIPPDEVKSE